MGINDKKQPERKYLTRRIVEFIRGHLHNISKYIEVEVSRVVISSELKKNADLREQLLKEQEILKERQKLLAHANSHLPIFFDKEEQLLILEAMLLARVRDKEPVDDVIAAIELIKKGVDDSISPSPEMEKKLVIHRYHFPILSEIGDIIEVTGRAIMVVSVVAYSGLVIFFLHPPSCGTRSFLDEDFENRSSYCQMLMKLNRFFVDYQKIDESQKQVK